MGFTFSVRSYCLKFQVIKKYFTFDQTGEASRDGVVTCLVACLRCFVRHPGEGVRQ